MDLSTSFPGHPSQNIPNLCLGARNSCYAADLQALGLLPETDGVADGGDGRSDGWGSCQEGVGLGASRGISDGDGALHRSS